MTNINQLNSHYSDGPNWMRRRLIMFTVYSALILGLPIVRAQDSDKIDLDRLEQLVNAQRDEAKKLFSAATEFLKKGECAEAIPLFERVRVIYKKALGVDHPKAAQTSHYLALCYAKTGKLSDAETQFALAFGTLAIEAMGDVDRDRELANTAYDFAAFYVKQGNYDEAAKMAAKALAVREKIEPNAPETTSLRKELAGLYRKTGEIAKAESLERQPSVNKKQKADSQPAKTKRR